MTATLLGFRLMIPASLANIRSIIEKSYPFLKGTELVEREGKNPPGKVCAPLSGVTDMSAPV